MKKAYKEPEEFIPEDIRKEFKLGEYAEEENEEEKREVNKTIRDYVKGK